jgi:hypothetical protein
VFGAIGAKGRVVDEPTVVPGAVLSATRGPLQGAHINKRPNTTTAAINIMPAAHAAFAAVQIITAHSISPQLLPKK